MGGGQNAPNAVTTTTDSCVKIGSGVSRLMFQSLWRNKVIIRPCPVTTTSEEKGKPKRTRTNVPLLASLTSTLTARPKTAHARKENSFLT